MPCCHCKTCRSPLHVDDTHAECVSCLGKSHADAVFSRTDCSHCESFSLASLRSRIVSFHRAIPPPSLPHVLFLPGTCEEKTARQRIRVAGDKQAHTGPMPTCLAITTERAFACPLHSTRSASFCSCERHDLVRCE